MPIEGVLELVVNCILQRQVFGSRSFQEMVLYTFLGSGPGRGRSPVEWGEIPSVLLLQLPEPAISPVRVQSPV